MKFEERKHYNLFGYDVVLISDPRLGPASFRVYKDKSNLSIDMSIDKDFLKSMDSTEMRKLELMLRDLQNYAKFGDSEE